jgi:hypothetical protein
VARKAKTLPLDDDLRWQPFEAMHRQLMERIGDPHLAAFDLTEALTSKVRSSRRRRETGYKRELTPFAWWVDYELRWWAKETLSPKHRALSGFNVCPREPGKKGAPYLLTLGVASFFLWGPDYDARWPPQNPETEVGAKSPLAPQEPAPKAVNVKRLPPNKRAEVTKELIAQFKKLNDGSVQDRNIAKDLVVAAMAKKGFIAIPWQMLENACVWTRSSGGGWAR